jgi:hypothetical protein
MNRFSDEQITAMRANIEFQRPGLLLNPFLPDLIPDTFEVVLTAPDSGAVFDVTSSVTLEWEAVPGAIGYAVDFDFYVPFNGATINYRSYTTSTNSLTINNLQSNRTYVWRVRPFSRYDGCTVYSPPKAFTVGTFVDSKEATLANYGLRAFPQPASLSTGHFSVAYEIPGSEPAQLRLINSSGQAVQNLQLEAQPGKQVIEVPTRGLPPGFYLLELTTNTGRWVEKLSLSR